MKTISAALYVVLEWLCILGFCIGGIVCLKSAYAGYNDGHFLGFLWLVVGGIVLIGIAIGGAAQLFKRAFPNHR